MNSNISNKSKALVNADDSEARLLIDLLKGTTGRNFDIESLFVEKLDDNTWRWVVYEFLKADTIPPQKSHPNYYWHKNKRKFLSLWAVIQTLRKASFRADLILVNYSDNKVEGIKEMIVQSIKENTSKVFRASSTDNNGNIKKALLNHVDTIDQLLTYEQWKHNFKNFVTIQHPQSPKNRVF